MIPNDVNYPHGDGIPTWLASGDLAVVAQIDQISCECRNPRCEMSTWQIPAKLEAGRLVPASMWDTTCPMCYKKGG